MNEHQKHAIVAELRAKTGMPMMECKKALHIKNYDIAAAEEYLLSHDWKLGKLITYRERKENSE